MTPSSMASKTPRILIVDQDPKSRERLSFFLHEAHPEYEITYAEDSVSTMRKVEEFKPDLIFLDVLMPDNEGFDLCLLLRADERYREIPVLILTALDRIEHKVRAFNMGANDYLVKPINAVETNARVEAQLRIKRFQDRQKVLNEELRHAQAALAESSKMSAVGTLAAGVAHEFNNILQIISATAELAAAREKSAVLQELLGTIEFCTARGRKIAKGLMEFAKKEGQQKRETFQVEELLRQNLDLMAKTFEDAGITVVTDLHPSPPAEGYPGQLSQVFVHLFKNAAEAMRGSAKRELFVSLKPCGCPGPFCQDDPAKEKPREEGCLVIVCRDTGRGISADMLPRIFEPFVTTKGVLGGGTDTTPGAGLGLSVSYGIIRRHDGSIHAESAEGKGTTFTLTLPVVRRHGATIAAGRP